MNWRRSTDKSAVKITTAQHTYYIHINIMISLTAYMHIYILLPCPEGERTKDREREFQKWRLFVFLFYYKLTNHQINNASKPTTAKKREECEKNSRHANTFTKYFMHTDCIHGWLMPM